MHSQNSVGPWSKFLNTTNTCVQYIFFSINSILKGLLPLVLANVCAFFSLGDALHYPSMRLAIGNENDFKMSLDQCTNTLYFHHGKGCDFYFNHPSTFTS